MSKVAEIVDGWRNYVARDPSIEKLAAGRAAICVACPELVKKGNAGVSRCALCGCPIATKTRSVGSKCPINKW